LVEVGGTIALAILLMAAPAAGDAGGTVLFLTAPQPVADDAAIAEAVAIYTRDLGLVVRQVARAPSENGPERVAEVAALVRAEGARLAFWVRPGGPEGGQVLCAVSRSSPSLIEVKLAGVEGDRARALALEVRALVTGGVDPPKPTGPVVEPRRDARLLLALGYRLTLPTDTALLRQGIVVEAALPLGRYLEPWLALELTTAPTRTVGNQGQASLLDVPIRTGLHALWRRGRATLGLGPTFALHLVMATALGTDGTSGSAFRVEAGLGGDLLGRVRITDRIAVELHFLVEELLPNNHFQLHGTPALDGGGLLFGLGATLVFAPL
jgi:hypothetical protein